MKLLKMAGVINDLGTDEDISDQVRARLNEWADVVVALGGLSLAELSDLGELELAALMAASNRRDKRMVALAAAAILSSTDPVRKHLERATAGS